MFTCSHVQLLSWRTPSAALPLGSISIAVLPSAAAWRKAARSAIWWGQASSRSEEHTSELQSLMRISYAVFCLKKKIINKQNNNTNNVNTTQHRTHGQCSQTTDTKS